MTALEIRVIGVPASAGSKTIVPTAAGPRVVDGGSAAARRTRATWRADVIDVARRELDNGATPFAPGTPLRLEVELIVARPKNLPKRRPSWPITRPDITKLLRATEDALTVAGVWHDDAQIIEQYVFKRYALTDEPTGARIRIEMCVGYIDQTRLEGAG